MVNFIFVVIADDHIVIGVIKVTCGEEAGEYAIFGGKIEVLASGEVGFGVLCFDLVGSMLFRRGRVDDWDPLVQHPLCDVVGLRN